MTAANTHCSQHTPQPTPNTQHTAPNLVATNTRLGSGEWGVQQGLGADEGFMPVWAPPRLVQWRQRVCVRWWVWRMLPPAAACRRAP